MKVLHLVSSPARSGVTATIGHLALGLQSRAFEPALVHYGADDGIAPELRGRGVCVRRIAAPPPALGPLRTWWVVSRARRIVEELAPDLVHAHSFDADLVACRAVAGGDVPVIVSFHSFSYVDWAKAHQDLYVRHGGPIRQFIAVSALLGRQVAEIPGFRGKPIATVFNAPDERFFAPVGAEERARSRRRLGLAEADKAVVCVANFHPIKGLEVLARAFLELARGREDVRLVIMGAVGADAERQACQRQVEGILSEGNAGRRAAIIGGAVDARPALAAADVYVQPSHMEALSVALGEAMACGLPVVATAVGGNSELVSQRTGILVPPADPVAMARAVERLLDSPELSARLGAAAKAFAEKHLSLSAMLDAHARIYSSCARASGNP